jgi:flagellar export protein FliJ
MARRFEFRLQTLLDVRRLREREAKRAFATQQAEIARLDQLNRETTAEIAAQQAALLGAMQAGPLDLMTLQRGRAWIAHLRKTITQRLQQRVAMVQSLESLRGQWTAARTQMRIVEKLRERRWTRYRKDRQRREQTEADELARQLPMFGLNAAGLEPPSAAV